MRRLLTFALLAAAAIASPAARADGTATFTITSVTDTNFTTFVFSLPGSPTPNSYDSGQFTVTTDVTVTNGSSSSTFSDIFEFYNTANDGGLTDNSSYGLSVYSPQLFTGDLSAPTFAVGSYDLSAQSPGGRTDYTLTIAATPEPSSLLLLGTGALALAGAARRRFVQ